MYGMNHSSDVTPQLQDLQAQPGKTYGKVLRKKVGGSLRKASKESSSGEDTSKTNASREMSEITLYWIFF